MADCPWNGCNRIRGIEFPVLASVNYGYFTGDGVYNRQMIIGFNLKVMDIMRIESGSIYGFRKTEEMLVWKVYKMDTGMQYDNEMKIIENGFELRNAGGNNLNLNGFLYQWFAIGGG